MAWVALGSRGHFLWPIALTLSLKWFWLNNNLGESGGSVIWSGAETGLRTQLSLWLSTEGGQQETGDPIPHLVILSPRWCGPQYSLVPSSCLFSQGPAGLIVTCPSWLSGSCVRMRNAAVRVREEGQGAEGLDCWSMLMLLSFRLPLQILSPWLWPFRTTWPLIAAS